MGYSLRRIKKDTQKNRAAGKITCIDWESCWKTKTFTYIKCSYTIMKKKKKTTVHEISTHKTELQDWWLFNSSSFLPHFLFFLDKIRPSTPLPIFPNANRNLDNLLGVIANIFFLYIGVHSSTCEPSFYQLTQKVQQLVIGSLRLWYPEAKRKYC